MFVSVFGLIARRVRALAWPCCVHHLLFWRLLLFDSFCEMVVDYVESAKTDTVVATTVTKRRYTKKQLAERKAGKNGQSPGAAQGQNIQEPAKGSGKGKGPGKKGQGKGKDQSGKSKGKGKGNGPKGKYSAQDNGQHKGKGKGKSDAGKGKWSGISGRW